MVCGPSALSRFDRDVLSVPGAKFLIILEGINDITHPVGNSLPEQAVTPEHPTRLRPDYDSGDHVHPNDAGYLAMAEAIDLRVFEGR